MREHYPQAAGAPCHHPSSERLDGRETGFRHSNAWTVVRFGPDNGHDESMISIFVEPVEAFARRAHTLPAPILGSMTAREVMARSTSAQATRQPTKDYARDLIMEILRFEGEVPVPITEVVNRASRWTTHDTRSDRERAKLGYFRLVGDMIRAGILRRISRNYVLIAPPEERLKDRDHDLAPIELPPPLL